MAHISVVSNWILSNKYKNVIVPICMDANDTNNVKEYYYEKDHTSRFNSVSVLYINILCPINHYHWILSQSHIPLISVTN